MIQVVICSPTPALRAGLRALLTGDPDLNVFAAVHGIDSLPDPLPEALVIVSTQDALDLPNAHLPEGQALLLVTNDGQELSALAGMGLPAWGAVTPEATAEILQSAVRALAQGLIILAPELGEAFLTPLLSQKPDLEDENNVEHLTEREGEVLRWLAQGLTNKQIALNLQISEHTVKFHVSSIYGKLGVSNRTEAVRKGARLGWIPL